MIPEAIIKILIFNDSFFFGVTGISRGFGVEISIFW
jgi:hypothetical protein